jgi:hypothetical protein
MSTTVGCLHGPRGATLVAAQTTSAWRERSWRLRVRGSRPTPVADQARPSNQDQLSVEGDAVKFVMVPGG